MYYPSDCYWQRDHGQQALPRVFDQAGLRDGEGGEVFRVGADAVGGEARGRFATINLP